MSLKSVGLQSDLLSLTGLSKITECTDHVVLRTPDEPNYWHGNIVIMRRATADPEVALTYFRSAFPDASHVCVVWDVPNLDPVRIRSGILGLPVEVETFDVLTMNHPVTSARITDDLVLRTLSGAEDWQRAFDLQLEIAEEEGNDPNAYRRYLEQRNSARRSQIAHGLGQWFGAFEDDLLVAQMGLFHDERLARFQSVETRKTHRRRGICTALLTHVIQWTYERAPRATQVIVAEADSSAGRLYRKCGFRHCETLVEMTKAGH